jgi:hypothetical protein
MITVADIAPLNGSPGLRAFLCEACGNTDSILMQGAGAPGGMTQGRTERGQ